MLRPRSSFAALLAVLLFSAALASPAAGRWETARKLISADAAQGDLFGRAIAISGDTVLVGAPSKDETGTFSGSAYMFDINTGEQILQLTPNDLDPGDRFGSSVAIDENNVIVGADDDGEDAERSGAAYVFDSNTGEQLYKLTAEDAGFHDEFGISVSIDGDIAIVGAHGDNSAAGSAYVFNVNSGQQINKLVAQDAAPGDRFGASVDISENTAVVGALRDDDLGNSSGSAYLFDITSGEQSKKLVASDGAATDDFGRSVGISRTGVIVGGNGNDDAGHESGSAYLLDPATGTQTHKLTADDAEAEDAFGVSVANDENVAVIGTVRAGSAYIFDSSTGQQLARLTANDASADDQFGVSTAISDGIAVVGAPRANQAGENSGAVYIFRNTTTDPTPDPVPMPDPPGASDAAMQARAAKRQRLTDAANVVDDYQEKAVYSKLPGGITGRKNLVLIAHGWTSEPDKWATGLAEDINERLGERREHWDVVAYDWEEEAGSLASGPGVAMYNGKMTGAAVGVGIDMQQYEKVHLIGHSAGSWLIDAASDKVQTLAVEEGRSLDVQTTFLDAYTPFGIGANELGDTADWAAHYVDRRFTGLFSSFLGAPVTLNVATNSNLRNAYNFDVSLLDPNPVRTPPDAHAWPYEWYSDTAKSSAERLYDNPASLGFFKSLTQGEPDYFPFAEGERATFGQTVPPEEVTIRIKKGVKESLTAAHNFFSDTGTVEIPSSTANSTPAVILETGSPVWMMSEFEVDHEFNFLEFDYEFASEPGAEGWLSVYFEDELIFEADERFALDGLNSEFAVLGQEFSPGSYWLTFRVDPFSDVQSRIELSNLRFSLAQATIPEPGTLVLCGVGVLGLALRRPRRRKAAGGRDN